MMSSFWPYIPEFFDSKEDWRRFKKRKLREERLRRLLRVFRGGRA